jgi:pimeloyl-ACP methyl ester carboxylesterase
MLPITDTRPKISTNTPTLVTSHSFGFSRREWIEVADLLSDRYRTVAVDAPGFGDARDVTGYSMQKAAEQFAQTINELHLERFVLVGHSMTGKVMQILASRMGPELGLKHKPEKMVLVTPTPLGPEVGGPDLPRALLTQDRNQENGEKFVNDRSALPLPPAVHARAVEDYFKGNPAAWAAWCKEGIYEDWIDRAAPIEVETLVIVADHDPVWGLDMQKKLTLPYLQNGTITTVDCGHQVPMEVPDQLAALLRDFVGS